MKVMGRNTHTRTHTKMHHLEKYSRPRIFDAAAIHVGPPDSHSHSV